ncbi:hypothetical protein ACOMHN_018298 [Nucella lapillus]
MEWTVGGHILRNAGVKDPSAVGDVVYQGEVEGPQFREVADDRDMVLGRHLLSSNATEETTSAPAAPDEDKSIWEKIEEFYSDNNNMAMYCVLPLIVLVYGGCSAIYCVYKCRRYFRRRGKHKRLRNEDSNSVSEDEKNDLNQDGDGAGRPVKTVSGTTWEDNYNVERKKTPLPWDTPAQSNQYQHENSLAGGDKARESREANYSAGSRDSTSLALEREREKLERGGSEVKASSVEVKVRPAGAEEDNSPQQRPPPSSRNNHRSSPNSKAPPPPARPLEIVPISQKEYQQHMEASGIWDPLHQRPFDSRASGVGGGASENDERSRQGRESAWSIRDEIMAKYDALTSLAMAKKTAGVLRSGTYDDNLDSGHRPDTLQRKPGKKKLIFIAE